MKDCFRLIESISEEYGIKRGEHEGETQWKRRVIYSYIGQMGYASLFDLYEETDTSSISRFKNRMNELLSSFICIFPEIGSLSPTEIKTMGDDIYECMSHSGCFYHQPFRLVPPKKCEAKFGKMVFLRGYPIEGKRQLSGLGAFLEASEYTGECNSDLQRMFQLHDDTLTQAWQLIASERQWHPFDGQFSLEYLNPRLTGHTNEWLNHPMEKAIPFLARTQDSFGASIYYMYRMESGNILLSQLPEWQTAHSEYRFISAVCLNKIGKLPPVKYHRIGNLTTLRFSYLLPPAEMNLFWLYSWPENPISNPSKFTRIMNTTVFRTLKSFFMQKGYHFEEE